MTPGRITMKIPITTSRRTAWKRLAGWPGGEKDFPEHFAAGLKPHAVREKYYFARFQQRVNRVVDISGTVERKVDVLLENKAQGPAGEAGARLKKGLASRGQRLPLLGNDDVTAANRAYIKEFVLKADAELGKKIRTPIRRAVPLHRSRETRC